MSKNCNASWSILSLNVPPTFSLLCLPLHVLCLTLLFYSSLTFSIFLLFLANIQTKRFKPEKMQDPLPPTLKNDGTIWAHPFKEANYVGQIVAEMLTIVCHKPFLQHIQEVPPLSSLFLPSPFISCVFLFYIFSCTCSSSSMPICRVTYSPSAHFLFRRTS